MFSAVRTGISVRMKAYWGTYCDCEHHTTPLLRELQSTAPLLGLFCERAACDDEGLDGVCQQR
jgi:hypothetical protein